MPTDATGPHEYVEVLTGLDRLRVRHMRRRGTPVEIMAQLECFIDGRWRAVRRYDTHMGLHVHTAPWDDALDRRVRIQGGNLKSALTAAIADLRDNRDSYRAACEAAQGSD